MGFWGIAIKYFLYLSFLFFTQSAFCQGYEKAISDCRKAVEKYKNTSDSDLNKEEFKTDCMNECSVNRAKKNNWEIGQFYVEFKKCLPQEYNCGNKPLCRTAVMDFRQRCRPGSTLDLCRNNSTETLAQNCTKACELPQSNNCNPLDVRDFNMAMDVCQGAPNIALIGDAQAAQIFQQRERDMVQNQGLPTQEASFRSVFTGQIPPAQYSRPPRTTAAATNDTPRTIQDDVKGQAPEAQATPGNGQNSTTAQNGEGGDNSGGGGGMGGAGGGGASSGGGAFASSSAGGNAASGAGNNGERVASNSASESTFGKDGGGGGAESVGGSGGGNNSLGRSAGRINPSSSGGGDIGGAAGGRGGIPLLPSSAFTKTASNGRGSAPGTVSSDQFRPQFHGKNGSGGAGGVGSSTQVASKDAAGKIKKKKKRPGAGDSLSAFLASMWGKKSSKNSGGGRSPASVQRTHNPEIGRGLHDVFRPVTTYFNQQPLEEDGSLSE